VLRSPLFVAVAVVAALAVFVSGAASQVTRPSSFPVTIVTAQGKVTVAKKPRRIVSLSPTATESLFAIGAGPQVIAVDDQSNYRRPRRGRSSPAFVRAPRRSRPTSPTSSSPPRPRTISCRRWSG
jgi:ABC-type Fe3+-hydroxamate transport system substrate-binding protein